MSVERRGDKWLARVNRTVDGKLKLDSKAFATKAEAKEWEADVRRQRRLRLWVEPSRESLNAYLDRWLAGPMEARQRTREDYGRLLRCYVRPLLGAIRLDQLSTDAIRRR